MKKISNLLIKESLDHEDNYSVESQQAGVQSLSYFELFYTSMLIFLLYLISFIFIVI